MGIDPFERSWAAGLFEGEGSFYVVRSGGRVAPFADLGSTDLDVLERFYRFIRVGNIRNHTPTQGKPHWKPAWKWATGSFEGVQYVAGLLWPQLGARRKEQIVKSLEAVHEYRTLLRTRRVNLL